MMQPAGFVTPFLRLAESTDKVAFCWECARDVVWLSPGFSGIFDAPRAASTLEQWLAVFVPCAAPRAVAQSQLRHCNGPISITIEVARAYGLGSCTACISTEVVSGSDGGTLLLGTARLLPLLKPASPAVPSGSRVAEGGGSAPKGVDAPAHCSEALNKDVATVQYSLVQHSRAQSKVVFPKEGPQTDTLKESLVHNSTHRASSPRGAEAPAVAVAEPRHSLHIVIAVSKDSERNTLQKTTAKAAKRLTKAEPRITVCAQGRESVEAACNDGVDIVLMDAKMPASGGRADLAAQWLRQSRPAGTLVIIGLMDSSSSSKVSMNAADVSLFDETAMKPLSATKIMSLLQAHVPRIAVDQFLSSRTPGPQMHVTGEMEVASLPSSWKQLSTVQQHDPTINTLSESVVAESDGGCASTQRSSASILIADDSGANQMSLKRIVRKVGREVMGFEPNIELADDGRQVLQFVEQQQFNLIFMDIHMPIMNGIEALQVIRERYSRAALPVVAVSGTDEAAGPALSNTGFDEVVFKPISGPRVKKIIQTYLGADGRGVSPETLNCHSSERGASQQTEAMPKADLESEGQMQCNFSSATFAGVQDFQRPSESASDCLLLRTAGNSDSSRKRKTTDEHLRETVGSRQPKSTAFGTLQSSGSHAPKAAEADRKPDPSASAPVAAVKERIPKARWISCTEAFAPVSYYPISQLPKTRIQRISADSSDSGSKYICASPSSSSKPLRFMVACAGPKTMAILEGKLKAVVVQDLNSPEPIVMHVGSADQAMAATQAHHFDIVFVDLSSMSPGYSTVMQLRRKFNIASLKIVGFLSDIRDAQKAEDMSKELISLPGLNEVDVKPIPRGRVVQILIDHLACFRSLRNDEMQAESAKLAAMPRPVPSKKSRITCLVAEDEPIALQMTKRLLSKLDVEIIWVKNGFEAVAAVTLHLKGSIDIILMDCNMPIKDGWQATRAIRAWEMEHDQSQLPIVAVTANVREEDRRICFAAGMNDYVRKPVQKSLLIESITKLTGLEVDSSGGALRDSQLVSLPNKDTQDPGGLSMDNAGPLSSNFDSSRLTVDLSSISKPSELVGDSIPKAQHSPPRHSRGVLIVDEDVERLLHSKWALEVAGVVNVDVAAGGAQALLALSEGSKVYRAIMIASDLSLAHGAVETAAQALQVCCDSVKPLTVLLRETRRRLDLRAGGEPDQRERRRRPPEDAKELWSRIVDLPLKINNLSDTLADLKLIPAHWDRPGHAVLDEGQHPFFSQHLSLTLRRSLSCIRVLYIDDNEAMRGAVVRMLHAEDIMSVNAASVEHLCSAQGPLALASTSSSSKGLSVVLVRAEDIETLEACAKAIDERQTGCPIVAILPEELSSSRRVAGLDCVLFNNLFGPAAVIEAICEAVRSVDGSPIEELQDPADSSVVLQRPVADICSALREFEDDWDFLLSLMQCLLSNGYEQISSMVEAGFAKPMKLVQLKTLSHTLSGASATCRISNLAEVCRQIENLALEMMGKPDGESSKTGIQQQLVIVLCSTAQRHFLQVAGFVSWLRGLQFINVEAGLKYHGGDFCGFIGALERFLTSVEARFGNSLELTHVADRPHIVQLLMPKADIFRAASPGLCQALDEYKTCPSDDGWKALCNEFGGLSNEVHGLQRNHVPQPQITRLDQAAT